MVTSRLNRLPVGWWWIMPASGLLAGLVMALVWSLGSAFRGLGPWLPWNALGTLPTASLASTSFSVQTVLGLGLHLMVSVCIGVIAGGVVTLFFPQALRSWPRAVGSGLVAGAVAYVVMGRLIGPLLNPGIPEVIPATYVLGHLVYGAAVGLSLWAMLRLPLMAITWGPEAPEHPLRRHEAEDSLRR